MLSKILICHISKSFYFQISEGLQAGHLYEGEVSRNSTWLMIKQTEDFCFLLTSSPFRQIILDLELEQISCHIQVQSNVGMVDAGDLEPCTEYLVMIRWTLTTCLVMLLVTLLLVIL